MKPKDRSRETSSQSAQEHEDLPDTVRRLLPYSRLSASEMSYLAMRALGEPPADEIVPTAEGVTFFDQMTEARRAAEEAGVSVLQYRLDRINRRYADQ
jgi:hypothetical protein